VASIGRVGGIYWPVGGIYWPHLWVGGIYWPHLLAGRVGGIYWPVAGGIYWQVASIGRWHLLATENGSRVTDAILQKTLTEFQLP